LVNSSKVIGALLAPISLAVPTQYIRSLEHRLGHQILFQRRIVNQREIDLRRHQVHQRCSRQAFGERQLEIGISGKHRAHQRNADRLDAGIRHAHRNFSGDGAATLLDLALGLGHGAEDDPCMLVERSPAAVGSMPRGLRSNKGVANSASRLEM
jgi:hypothetical protein